MTMFSHLDLLNLLKKMFAWYLLCLHKSKRSKKIQMLNAMLREKIQNYFYKMLCKNFDFF